MDPTSTILSGDTVSLSPEQIAAAHAAAQPTPGQLADRARREGAMREAASHPLPGPLRDAFADLPRELLDQPLVDITAGHIAALVAINSPFLEAMRLGQLLAICDNEEERQRLMAKAESIKVEIADVVETLYIFSRSARETRNTLALRGGRAQIRASAEALLDTLPPITDWETINQSLGLHYAKCFLSHLAFESKSDPGGTRHFPMSQTIRGSAGSRMG